MSSNPPSYWTYGSPSLTFWKKDEINNAFLLRNTNNLTFPVTEFIIPADGYTETTSSPTSSKIYHCDGSYNILSFFQSLPTNKMSVKTDDPFVSTGTFVTFSHKLLNKTKYVVSLTEIRAPDKIDGPRYCVATYNNDPNYGSVKMIKGNNKTFLNYSGTIRVWTDTQIDVAFRKMRSPPGPITKTVSLSNKIIYFNSQKSEELYTFFTSIYGVDVPASTGEKFVPTGKTIVFTYGLPIDTTTKTIWSEVTSQSAKLIPNELKTYTFYIVTTTNDPAYDLVGPIVPNY